MNVRWANGVLDPQQRFKSATSYQYTAICFRTRLQYLSGGHAKLHRFLICSMFMKYERTKKQMDGFAEVFMLFMICHVFTTCSIWKMNLRPNPMQQNNQNINWKD